LLLSLMDYFENLELAPHAIKEIVRHHDFTDTSYSNIMKFLDKLIVFEWGADWNDNGKIFNLNPLNYD
jgi:hypothetical protein